MSATSGWPFSNSANPASALLNEINYFVKESWAQEEIGIRLKFDVAFLYPVGDLVGSRVTGALC